MVTLAWRAVQHANHRALTERQDKMLKEKAHMEKLAKNLRLVLVFIKEVMAAIGETNPWQKSAEQVRLDKISLLKFWQLLEEEAPECDSETIYRGLRDSDSSLGVPGLQNVTTPQERFVRRPSERFWAEFRSAFHPIDSKGLAGLEEVKPYKHHIWTYFIYRLGKQNQLGNAHRELTLLRQGILNGWFFEGDSLIELQDPHEVIQRDTEPRPNLEGCDERNGQAIHQGFAEVPTSTRSPPNPHTLACGHARDDLRQDCSVCVLHFHSLEQDQSHPANFQESGTVVWFAFQSACQRAINRASQGPDGLKAYKEFLDKQLPKLARNIPFVQDFLTTVIATLEQQSHPTWEPNEQVDQIGTETMNVVRIWQALYQCKPESEWMLVYRGLRDSRKEFSGRDLEQSLEHVTSAGETFLRAPTQEFWSGFASAFDPKSSGRMDVTVQAYSLYIHSYFVYKLRQCGHLTAALRELTLIRDGILKSLFVKDGRLIIPGTPDEVEEAAAAVVTTMIPKEEYVQRFCTYREQSGVTIVWSAFQYYFRKAIWQRSEKEFVKKPLPAIARNIEALSTFLREVYAQVGEGPEVWTRTRIAKPGFMTLLAFWQHIHQHKQLCMLNIVVRGLKDTNALFSDEKKQLSLRSVTNPGGYFLPVPSEEFWGACDMAYHPLDACTMDWATYSKYHPHVHTFFIYHLLQAGQLIQALEELELIRKCIEDGRFVEDGVLTVPPLPEEVRQMPTETDNEEVLTFEGELWDV